MDNLSNIHLSFTIGPVQGFVSQARRTRDLWAGSWLLSHLAEVALVAAEECGGTAIIPFRGEDSKKLTSLQTAIGGIPNRFELQFDSEEQAEEAAKKGLKKFQDAWEKIAAAVYNKYAQPVENEGDETQKIWNRQVNNFWELSWIIGTPEGGAKTLNSLTASRKNIRNVNATQEEGTKCSLMGNLQEISGCFKSNQQKSFWSKLQAKSGGLDIKPGERLCAIALIKRLYPYVIKKVLGDDISSELHQVSWSSTAFVAALPWLKSLKGEALEKAISYAQSANDAGYSRSEKHSVKQIAELDNWAGIDGPVWFASAIQQDEPGKEKLGENPSEEETNARNKEVEKLLGELRVVYKQADSKPIPYYALLLMDGDSMGKLVGSLGDPAKVSQGLKKFSDSVNNIVKQFDGRTIYAGGDDVLAILPAISAVAVATKLSKKYGECFGDIKQATLSGAIIYAHWKYPLRQVLQTAHHLLDDIAKERTGRDSLAIGVIQGSGLQAIWSAPWKVVRGEDGNGFGKLIEVIDHFETSTDINSKTFNASFLYHLREQFAKLFPKQNEIPGVFQQVDFPSDDEQSLLLDLAHAEYRRRMSNDERNKISTMTTKKEVKPLMALSHQWKRDEETAEIECNKNTFSFDGWRVARFLKQVKEGKVDDHG